MIWRKCILKEINRRLECNRRKRNMERKRNKKLLHQLKKCKRTNKSEIGIFLFHVSEKCLTAAIILPLPD